MIILFSGNFGYLCLAMRKKFGDWLLDIAKYMATAILLTSHIQRHAECMDLCHCSGNSSSNPFAGLMAHKR